MTPQDAVAGIAATVTGQGLKCTAVLDDADYPEGVKVPAARVAHLEDRVLDRDPFHGEWNYTVRPVPAESPPAPQPATTPAPDLERLAAEAGIDDLGALLEAVTPPWRAVREQRLHLARGHARNKDSGCTPLLPLAAVITAAARHHRLAATYRQLGDLLGVHESTVSLAVRRISPILEQQGITPRRPGRQKTAATATRPRQPT
jgi:hypothetical protein